MLASKTGNIIIRHLVLPGHVDCCSKKIIEWIGENLSGKVKVNIMDQYHPCYKAVDYPEINKLLSDEEFKELINFAVKKRINILQ